MENKIRREHGLGRLRKLVKHFVKEAEQIEHEATHFNLQWPLKIV